MTLQDANETLIALLRCVHGATDTAAIGAIAADDWPAIVRAATVHGLAPYLYVKFTTMALSGRLPEEVIELFRDEYQRTSLANMKIYQELPRALACLARESIPVLLLKGAHLARFVYPYEAMRPMEDVDLLVDPADYSRATEVLLNEGYRLTHAEEHWAGEDPQERHTAVTAAGGVTIELHRTFDLSPTATRARAADAFARAGRVSIGGAEAYVMASEDLLLHVAMHASYQHGFGLGMLVLCDIAVILQHFQGRVDWDAFTSRARAWGADRGVWMALVLAEELAGVPVPPEVVDRLRPAQSAHGFREAARRRILHGKEARPTTSSTLTQAFGQGSLGARLRLVVKRLFPPRREIARLYHVRVDSPKIWCFYPVRLRDVVQRHLPTAWRLVRGDRHTHELAARVNEETALRAWLRGGGE